MARIVNEAAYTAKRNAILDAAQRAVATTGYEQMAIADLLSELQISSGAFYHYFDSKQALLFALVERMVEEIEQIVLPIVHDPSPGALDRLQRFFAAINEHKKAHRRLVLGFLHVWYADENAIVRHKLYRATTKRLAPLLSKIIQEGVEEGVFTTPYPDQAARMVFSLFEDLGYATIDILIAEEHDPSDLLRIVRIVEACADALERLLGAPAGCLQHVWSEELEPWLASPTLLKEEQRVQP